MINFSVLLNSVTYNYTKKFIATDGEEIKVIFKTFNKVDGNVANVEIGEYIGALDVLYPIAGLNVLVTLDVFQGFSDEFKTKTGVIKIPFVDKLITIAEIEDALNP